MKKTLFIMCAILASADLRGETNDTDVLPVIFPEGLAQSTNRMSAEELESMNLRAKAYAKFPKSDTFYTLGQLLRMSDTIAVVTIIKIEGASDPLDFSSKVKTLVTFSPERTLFGKPREKKTSIRFTILDRSGRPLPREGDRCLVFIADDDEQAKNLIRAIDWRFDKAAHPAKPHSEPAFVGNISGIIPLDGGQDERGLLAAIEELLLNLRRGDRDRERYYAGLLELTRSPVRRVSNDAHQDLLKLVRFDPSLDLNRILADDAAPECLKEFIRLIQIPEREKAERKKSEQQKTEQPKPQ